MTAIRLSGQSYRDRRAIEKLIRKLAPGALPARKVTPAEKPSRAEREYRELPLPKGSGRWIYIKDGVVLEKPIHAGGE